MSGTACRRSWLVLFALLSCADPGSAPEQRTGVNLEIVHDSTLPVSAFAVLGWHADGSTALDRAVFAAPLSLDPPGVRSTMLVVDLQAGSNREVMTIRVDALDGGEAVVGSGQSDVVVIPRELVDASVRVGLPVICGDGVLQTALEACDDGNIAAGDGCSPMCVIEESASCSTDPSLCPPPPPPPPPPSSGARIRRVEQLAAQETRSVSFVDVPGTTLRFTPSSSSEVWLVFVSGRIRSTDPSETSAEMRLLINDVEVDLFGHQTRGSEDNWAGFLTFDHVRGTTSSQKVQPQFRAETGTTAVDSLRVIAAPLPEDADFHVSETDLPDERTGPALTLEELSFTPPAAGSYVVLGKASQSEDPGNDAVQTWLERDDGTRRPLDERGSRFTNARGAWQPMFSAMSANLDRSPTKLALRGSSAGASTDWWATAYAYRRPITISGSTIGLGEGSDAVRLSFDHRTLVGEAKARADGRDVRITQKSLNGWVEVDRVLDPDSAWGQTDTTLWFPAATTALDGTEPFYLYYGDPIADVAPEDPHQVFLLYEDFSDAALDGARWISLGASPVVSSGILELGPEAGIHGAPSYEFGVDTRWEAKVALSDPSQDGLQYWGGGREERANPHISFSTQTQQHFVTNNGFSSPVGVDTPTSFHVYAFDRFSFSQVRYFQDGNLLTTHFTNIPIGTMPIRLVNAASRGTIRYDWVRVRRLVEPEPATTLEAEESFTGNEPSSWRYRKLIAFRADAFDAFYYDESPALESSTSSEIVIKGALSTPSPTRLTDYLVIQSLRISGESSESGRKSGILRADGRVLVETSHKINREGGPIDGYHHNAGVAHALTAAESMRLENGFASPDGLSVDAADSVIIVLGYPPLP